MSLLTPDFGLLFWMLVCFGAVFGILAKWGFPVITRAVRDRRDYINRSVEAADEANRRLEGIRAEGDRLLAEAQARQNEIVRQAAADGERIVQNARDNAAREAEKQLETARRQIEVQKQKALADIRTQVAVLAVDIAEKILRGELDDKAKQDSLIDRMIDEAARRRESENRQ